MHIKLSIKPYNIVESTAQISELVKTIHEIQCTHTHSAYFYINIKLIMTRRISFLINEVLFYILEMAACGWILPSIPPSIHP